MKNLQTLELSSNPASPSQRREKPDMFELSSNEAFSPQRREPKKKLEISELGSNLLLFSSIAIALTPFLLGDHLSLLVAGFTRDCLFGLSQFGDYLVGLLS